MAKKCHGNVTDKSILSKLIECSNWLDSLLYGENNAVKVHSESQESRQGHKMDLRAASPHPPAPHEQMVFYTSNQSAPKLLNPWCLVTSPCIMCSCNLHMPLGSSGYWVLASCSPGCAIHNKIANISPLAMLSAQCLTLLAPPGWTISLLWQVLCSSCLRISHKQNHS